MIQIAINYWAIFGCGVLSMVLGFLWYGPLFGKKYMHYVGVSQAEIEKFKKDPAAKRKMNVNYALTFVVAMLTAFILAHFLVLGSILFGLNGMYATVKIAGMAWLGFVVPSVLGGVFWERKAWGWFFLVSGYYLVQLVLMGIVLTLWM